MTRPAHANDSADMQTTDSAADSLEGLISDDSNAHTETEVSKAEDTPAQEIGDYEQSTSFNDENNDGQNTDTPDGSASRTEFSKIEIKGDKQLREFTLDPDNKELLETLKYGVGARRAFNEAAVYKKKLADLESKYEGFDDVRQKANIIDDVKRLVEQGHTTQAIKAILGDEGFDSFRKQEIISTIDYENAPPEERYEMDLARKDREKQWEMDKSEKRIQELETRANKQQDQVEFDRIHGLGETYLAKYDLSDYISDADTAQQMNDAMWNLAWDDIKVLKEQGVEIAASHVEKAFRRRAHLLRGSLKKSVDERLNKATDAKRETAKTQAQMIARTNYTSAQDSNTSMVDKLKSATSNLDRLKILGGY